MSTQMGLVPLSMKLLVKRWSGLAPSIRTGGARSSAAGTSTWGSPGAPHGTLSSLQLDTQCGWGKQPEAGRLCGSLLPAAPLPSGQVWSFSYNLTSGAQ